jgi:hypothetical protein
MPRSLKVRKSAPKQPLLIRTMTVSGFSVRMGINASQPRGVPPSLEMSTSLELRGTLNEPVRGVVDVEIHLGPEDHPGFGETSPAAVGAIVGMRPNMSIWLRWPPREFDRLWAMTLGGALKFVRLVTTPPKHNSGLVISAYFSSEVDE